MFVEKVINSCRCNKLMSTVHDDARKIPAVLDGIFYVSYLLNSLCFDTALTTNSNVCMHIYFVVVVFW